MGRPKNVYRGKRKYGWLITLILFLVIFVLMAAIWLFYYLQKYIVYDKDGLSLVLPSGQEDTLAEEPAPLDENLQVAPPVTADVVVTAPDYSGLEVMAGENVTAIRAKYIPAENVTAANLNYCAATFSDLEADALVLQLKPVSGFLSYFSSLKITSSYDVNGLELLDEALAALKDKGAYLVAEISCLADNAMASRNTPLALRNGSGGVLTDGTGAWLDPYNLGTRDYLAGLLEEIAAMGFDEVLLVNIAYPDAEDVQFSQAMSYSPDPVSCVSSLSLFLRDKADELGLRLSAAVDAEALRAGNSAGAGQDLSFFFKVFDRVYVETESNYYVSDMSTLESALGRSGSPRIVPIAGGFVPESVSYVLR
ncbi:MAG: putative glycoside hydrolase [Oscillospiraceae bacterium]